MLIYLLYVIVWFSLPILFTLTVYLLYRKFSEDSEISKEIVSGMILVNGFRIIMRELTKTIFKNKRR